MFYDKILEKFQKEVNKYDAGWNNLTKEKAHRMRIAILWLILNK